MRVCVCVIIWNQKYHNFPLQQYNAFWEYCANVHYQDVLYDQMVMDFITIPVNFVYYRKYFECYIKSYGYDADIQKFCPPDYLLQYADMK